MENAVQPSGFQGSSFFGLRRDDTLRRRQWVAGTTTGAESHQQRKQWDHRGKNNEPSHRFSLRAPSSGKVDLVFPFTAKFGISKQAQGASNPNPWASHKFGAESVFGLRRFGSTMLL